MEEFEESSCPTESPLVKIVPKKPGYTKKPSNFSVLRADSKHSDATYIQSRQDTLIGECRICLEGSNEFPIFKPCKCTGTVEYAHEKCLKLWIIRKMEKGEKNISCELCQTQYNYQHFEIKKFECSEIQKNWQRKKKQVCCYLALYIIGIICLIAFTTLVLIASNDNNLKSRFIPTQTIMLVYVGAILLCFLFLILVTFIFLGEFCLKKQYTVIVRKYSPPKTRFIRKSSRSSVVKV